jgi:cytochrome c oxidase subunit III
MTEHPVLDVRALPTTTVDHRALAWWGNAGMLVIEGAMFAMTAATYLYLRTQVPEWPQPPIPRPEALEGSVLLAVLALACWPMRRADLAARRGDEPAILRNLAVVTLAGLVALVLRGLEYGAMGCRWTDGAYGSAVWLVLFMHSLHLLGATGEIAYIALAVKRHGGDRKRRLDVRLSAAYWYFVAAWWLPLHLLLQLGAR